MAHNNNPRGPIKKETDHPSVALVVSLFIPWFLSLALQFNPILSYLAAWLGSFFIFFQTWFSSYRYVLTDLPIYQQIMRPLFLQQLTFAGFMCCTSIFFFFDTLGYNYFEHVNHYNLLSLLEPLDLLAKCQRISVAGHAALVTGVLFFQSKSFSNKPLFKPSLLIPLQVWIIRLSVISFVVSLVLQNIPPLSQFSIGLYDVAVFSGAVIFVKGVTQRKLNYLIWGGCIFVLNVVNSTLSGFKEPIIINFILVGCLLYPHNRKLVLISSVPAFFIIIFFAASYTTAFRKQAWEGQATAEEARTEAIESILGDEEQEEAVEDQQTNWDFFANRLSEIGMFTEFARSTPDLIPYYNTELLQNAILAIIPRALWKDKPVTETLAMERVYTAGVISRNSNVSAKTRPIVDGYLSAGLFGAIIYMFFLGSISQVLCNKAEQLFGGYGIGCVIIYNGFFQQLWRGETIEFLLNTIFWSFVMMMLVFNILKYTNFLVKHNPRQ